jgi:hypothetical protein
VSSNDDFLLKLPAIASCSAGSLAGRGDRARCRAFPPDNAFTDRCRDGIDLCLLKCALLCLVEIILNLEGDGGKRQPLESVRVAVVVPVAGIPVTIRPQNDHIAVVTCPPRRYNNHMVASNDIGLRMPWRPALEMTIRPMGAVIYSRLGIGGGGYCETDQYGAHQLQRSVHILLHGVFPCDAYG